MFEAYEKLKEAESRREAERTACEELAHGYRATRNITTAGLLAGVVLVGGITLASLLGHNRQDVTKAPAAKADVAPADSLRHRLH